MDQIELMHLEEGIQKIEKNVLKGDMRPVERDLIWKKMAGWPVDRLMPVIDVWRMHLLHSTSTDVFKGTDHGYSYIGTVCKLLKDQPGTPLAV